MIALKGERVRGTRKEGRSRLLMSFWNETSRKCFDVESVLKTIFRWLFVEVKMSNATMATEGGVESKFDSLPRDMHALGLDRQIRAPTLASQPKAVIRTFPSPFLLHCHHFP